MINITTKEKIQELIQSEGIESIQKIIDEISIKQNPAKEWLIKQINGLTIDIISDPDYIKYKKDNIYFWYDHKKLHLVVSYDNIWSILKSEFHLKYDEIKSLCQDTVCDTLKIKVNTTQCTVPGR